MQTFRFLALSFVGTSVAASLAAAGCVGDVSNPQDSGSDVAASDVVTPTDSGQDVVTKTDGQADAGDAAADAGPACDLSKPFGTPIPQTSLNTAAVEDAARISPNGLELFLMREDTVGKRIYRFTRTSPQAPWTLDGVQAPLSLGAAVDGGAPFGSSHVTLSSDALTAYLAVFRGGPWNIYFSQRTAIGQPWNAVQPVLNIPSGGFTDEMPWLNATGDRLYFMSNRANGFHLWTSTKQVNGFQTPIAVGAIEAAEDRSPVLSTDELTIYFGSYELAPEAGAPSMNIYKATRAQVGDLFANPVYVSELNVPGIFSAPTWLSADGCEIYLTSQRGGGGNFDVYSAVKPK